jgi:hypothetical protein
VWGVIWILVNLGGLVSLPYGSILFPAFMLLGFCVSLGLALRGGAHGRGDHVRRTVLITAAVVLFVTGMNLISPTNSLIHMEAMICLAVGALYMVAGSTLGWRLTAIGAAQLIGTMVAWVYGREQFFLWMALVGGGGLILGGLWLRRA